LINVKRVAFELRPAAPAAIPRVPEVPSVPKVELQTAVPGVPLPKAPAKPAMEPIGTESLTNRIDKFLAARLGTKPLEPLERVEPLEPAKPRDPEKFVCEDDVRQAVRQGRKLLINERTIVTPAARDAGEAAKIFVYAGWPQP
jgi:hypothetical protein